MGFGSANIKTMIFLWDSLDRSPIAQASLDICKFLFARWINSMFSVTYTTLWYRIIINLARSNAERLLDHCLIIFVCELHVRSFLSRTVFLTSSILATGVSLCSSGSHPPNRLFQLLDVFKLVVSLTSLSIFLLKLILFIIIFLGHSSFFRVRVLFTFTFGISGSHNFFLVLFTVSLLVLVLLYLLFWLSVTPYFWRSFLVSCMLFGDCFFFLGAWSLVAGTVWLVEDIFPDVDFFWEWARHILAALNGTLLLPGLALLVLFLFIRRVLSIIIGHVDFVSKLDAERAALYPRCFGF